MNPRFENILRKKAELLKRKKELGIRPKMEMIRTGGKLKGTFDLRSLNRNQAPKV